MSLKKRFILGVLLSALTAVYVHYAEYLPFTGKWMAAYRLDQYAGERYPGFRHGKVYFNPCGAPYETTFTGTSGEEVNLGCSYTGRISDPIREKRWQQDSRAGYCLDEVRLLNTSGWINCRWRYDAPEKNEFVLRVQMMESEEIPFPESETALREKMKKALAGCWDALPETARADMAAATVIYSHSAANRENQQKYDDVFYTVRIPVTDGNLSAEQVMTADLTERKT